MEPRTNQGNAQEDATWKHTIREGKRRTAGGTRDVGKTVTRGNANRGMEDDALHYQTP